MVVQMNVTIRRHSMPDTVPWYLLKRHNIELCLIKYKGDDDRLYASSQSCWTGREWSTCLDHKWMPCESLALGFVDACASNVKKLTVIVSTQGVILSKSTGWILKDIETTYTKTTAAKAITMITNLQAIMEVHFG